MTPARCCPRAEAGFTLLELLIAITIFALIMVALSEGVHFSGRAWHSWESRSSQQGDVDAVQAVLRQMIASGADFNGERGSLKFVGKLPAALERGGLFDITLNCDGDSLTLSWVPHFKGPSSRAAQQQDVTILDGVVTAGFAYHFETRGWQGQTSGQTKPLQLVALQARLANGRIWTPFVVAPMLAVPAKPKT